MNILNRFLTGHEKTLVAITWAIFISIGLLQMFRIREGFITNYGADIVCTGLLYYLTRTNKTVLKRVTKTPPTEIQTAVGLLACCFIWEFLQKFNMSGSAFFFTRGTFDPMDLLAYSVTILICYYLDATRIRSEDNKPTENLKRFLNDT
jgi:hypothetical protein